MTMIHRVDLGNAAHELRGKYLIWHPQPGIARKIKLPLHLPVVEFDDRDRVATVTFRSFTKGVLVVAGPLDTMRQIYLAVR